jgi:1-acyl-sn-glycerol-3-phosphate acyltransferase
MTESSATPLPEVNAFQRDPSEPTRFWWLCNAIARLFVTFCFDLKVHGGQHVPRRGGVLIVSNHQSYLDPVLMGVYLRRPMSYLAKSELFENKWFRWLITSLNAFPIRQGAGDVGAVKEIIRRLKEGHLLSMFPEGSRTGDGELMPIEPGASLVIRKADVPVVPCIILGSFQAWPRRNKMFRPFPIDVMFGPQLKVEGLKAKQITQLIDESLNRMVDQLRQIRRSQWPPRP